MMIVKSRMYFDKSGVETQLLRNLVFCQLSENLFKDVFLLQATKISVNAVPLTKRARQRVPRTSRFIHLMPLRVRRKSIQGRPIFFFSDNALSFDHSLWVNSYAILLHPKYILSHFVHSTWEFFYGFVQQR